MGGLIDKQQEKSQSRGEKKISLNEQNFAIFRGCL